MKNAVTVKDIQKFQKKIYDYYSKNRRSFDWREQITPYKVVVSEIMLQQTQTSRVKYKFDQWLQLFESFEKLALATTQQVLRCWQGLGYNRRGLALHELAKRVITEYAGKLPNDPIILETFKGIGPNTAGSICAFAFNMPVTFIETNIRTVFIHEFFQGQKNISDKQLLPLIEKAVDIANPRDWYYALMDYGVFLKKELKISNAASKHYTKQSTFIGSKRQLRGFVIKVLTEITTIGIDELQELVSFKLSENQHSLENVIFDLEKDGLLKQSNNIITIS